MFDDILPISISSKAAEEIRRIMENKNIPSDYGLRVGVKGGGCGGVSLLIGFDKMKESDLVYSIHGIRVYIDKKHTLYIIGKEIDFHDGEDVRGFMFTDSPRENISE